MATVTNIQRYVTVFAGEHRAAVEFLLKYTAQVEALVVAVAAAAAFLLTLEHMLENVFVYVLEIIFADQLAVLAVILLPISVETLKQLVYAGLAAHLTHYSWAEQTEHLVKHHGKETILGAGVTAKQ